MVVSIFDGDQISTVVFSIALPILGHTDAATSARVPETFGFVAKARQGSTVGERSFVVCSEMPRNSESRSFHKGGTQLRSDDLLAVEERSEQLTNWAGVNFYVAGTAEAGRVEAFWRAFFLKGRGRGGVLWVGVDEVVRCAAHLRYLHASSMTEKRFLVVIETQRVKGYLFASPIPARDAGRESPPRIG